MTSNTFHINPLAGYPLTTFYGSPRWPSWCEWDVPGTASEWPMSRRISTDQLSITEDEAVELCAHHLRLAALFYQSTPEDADATHGEILRLLGSAGHNDAMLAAGPFLAAMGEYYARLKKEYP